MYVDVETSSRICDGQTVGDVQNRLNHSPNMNVCEQVESEAFLELFIQVLNKE